MSSAMTSPPIACLLSEARDRTDVVVGALLERVEAGPAQVLAYQWGLRDAVGRPVPAGGGGRGKAVRAALVFAAARATGRPCSDPLVPAAATAVEMLHTLSLLHDDVMDGDELRRGRPAAWRVFGPDAVENAVRHLTPHAVGLFFDEAAGPDADPTVPPRDPEVLRGPAHAAGVLGAALVRLVQGQALDLALEQEAAPGVAATLRVHADKTGSLFSCACELGAVPAAAARLAAFGEHLGLAFQIVDDVLGIWGDPLVTGKPAGSDLTARKKSYPVAVALAPTAASDSAVDDARRRLAHLYARTESWTAAETDEARRLLDRTGARSVAEAAARRHERAALKALSRICLPDEEAGQDLRALAAFVTGRLY
ncbi:family 2 encapsulin nanocompartment cargo protein polyprenyl transferase [Streptomyces polychromogenes]|uniref:Family 2 encapsulin nanocompartment cargo protein polyprenyl transferase n=2 Tax=Streptomyces TaxID=1883 RepID=A0ABN0V1K1_9ACTN